MLVGGLPADLPAAVFVVLHVPAHGSSVMPQILSRAGALPAAHAVDGEEIRAGRIYVAPPNYHVLVKAGRVRGVRGPSENGHSPAADPLFRTAARDYGRRVVGVVLSGTLDDGTAGLQAVKERDGVAVVQDPETALFPGMPRSAMENVDVDHVLPLAEIAPLLERLARLPVEEKGGTPMSEEMEMETDIAEVDEALTLRDERPGVPSPFSCPECGGVLLELNDEKLFRFRCRTGHAYSPDSLLSEQHEALEEALWTALRALEESGVLARRLTERARGRGHKLAAAQFERQSHDADARAAIVRQALLNERRADLESTEPNHAALAADHRPVASHAP